MKEIRIELKDDEFEAIKSIYAFIKLKIGIKKAFLNGIFNTIDETITDEKLKNELEEMKKRIFNL